jgi:hypothetical protein
MRECLQENNVAQGSVRGYPQWVKLRVDWSLTLGDNKWKTNSGLHSVDHMNKRNDIYGRKLKIVGHVLSLVGM